MKQVDQSTITKPLPEMFPQLSPSARGLFLHYFLCNVVQVHRQQGRIPEDALKVDKVVNCTIQLFIVIHSFSFCIKLLVS